MSYFTCCKCERTFPKRNDDEWNDEKAREESLTLYPEAKDDPMDVLCDDCNEEFKNWFSKLTKKEKQKMRDDFYKDMK